MYIKIMYEVNLFMYILISFYNSISNIVRKSMLELGAVLIHLTKNHVNVV